MRGRAIYPTEEQENHEQRHDDRQQAQRATHGAELPPAIKNTTQASSGTCHQASRSRTMIRSAWASIQRSDPAAAINTLPPHPSVSTDLS